MEVLSLVRKAEGEPCRDEESRIARCEAWLEPLHEKIRFGHSLNARDALVVARMDRRRTDGQRGNLDVLEMTTAL